MRPIVNMPRATDIGNMHRKLVKIARVVPEISFSSRTETQTHRQTYSSQYFATDPAGEVITRQQWGILICVPVSVVHTFDAALHIHCMCTSPWNVHSYQKKSNIVLLWPLTLTYNDHLWTWPGVNPRAKYSTSASSKDTQTPLSDFCTWTTKVICWCVRLSISVMLCIEVVGRIKLLLRMMPQCVVRRHSLDPPPEIKIRSAMWSLQLLSFLMISMSHCHI